MKPDLARYRELFVHRSDVYAMQQPTGAYYPVQRPLTDDELAEHLGGMASYGVYVIVPLRQVSDEEAIRRLLPKEECGKNTVKYVVFDLDTLDKDALAHLEWCVNAVVDGLGADRTCLLAELSGGKGYHVWLFLSDPVPARNVRHWLEGTFWGLWTEGAEEYGWPMEVFPKQDSVDEGGYGNLVKLPLGKHAKSGNYSEFLGLPGWATGVSDVVPLESSLVPAVVEPAETSGGRGAASVRCGSRTPFPCIDRVLTGDVPAGKREDALFHLALYLYGCGVGYDAARLQVLSTNGAFEEPLNEREVEKTALKAAYSGRYRSGSCNGDWLRDFCPGPCPTWAKSHRPKQSQLRSLKEGDAVVVNISSVQRSGGKVRFTLEHPDAENRPTLVVD